MNIWIDFINTPQVTFFVPFINDFKKEGHNLLLTCRDSGNTVDLLQQNDLEFKIIGARAGKGLFRKAFYFPLRLLSLFLYIKNKKPDVAASQSSFYQPVVARLLGIPCLYTNDNEHAKGNIFGFQFASKVVLPLALKNEKFTKRKPLINKLSFYTGVKEGIYLSQFSGFSATDSKAKSKIYFRPEPSSAQYYNGPLNFFDNSLMKLAEKYEVIILPRDKEQALHYQKEKFRALKVASKPLSLFDIVTDCLLFIGAGGSMTREMAVLGIPVISIYQSGLLCVDKYLVDKGLMIINPDIDFDGILKIIGSSVSKNDRNSVLDDGRLSYTLIKKLIYNLQYE
jgi:hypothetical protein